jgi:hypothetical protein
MSLHSPHDAHRNPDPTGESEAPVLTTTVPEPSHHDSALHRQPFSSLLSSIETSSTTHRKTHPPPHSNSSSPAQNVAQSIPPSIISYREASKDGLRKALDPPFPYHRELHGTNRHFSIAYQEQSGKRGYLPGYPKGQPHHEVPFFLMKELMTSQLDKLFPHLWLCGSKSTLLF